jgi:hypothetical protein
MMRTRLAGGTACPTKAGSRAVGQAVSPVGQERGREENK